MGKLKYILLIILISTTSISPIMLSNSNNDIVSKFEDNGLSETALKTNNYEQFSPSSEVFENGYLPLMYDENDIANYELVATNSNLELYVNRSDLSILIHNLKTNYYWSSTVNVDYNDLDEEENPIYENLYNDSDDGFVSNSVKRRVRSAINIEYTSKSNTSIRFDNDNLLSAGSKITLNKRPRFSGFSADIYFGVSKIKLTLEVELKDNSIDVRVPYEKIEEDSIFLLGRVIVYQYFGAVYLDKIPGYIFVPDGSGALVRFQNKNGLQNYSKRFYNNDIGITGIFNSPDTGYQEEDLLANTYGIVHGVNQNACQIIVNSGDFYSSLKIDPAKTISYFWTVYPYFVYRNSYTQYLNKSHSLSITQLQNEIIPFDIDISYIFLSDEEANYVGFSNTYRNYLLGNNLIYDHQLSPNLKLNINSLGSVTKQLGIFKSDVIMTKVSDLISIVDDLTNSGVNDHTITYSGWSTSENGPIYKNINKKVGSKKDFVKLTTNYNTYLIENASFTRGNYQLKNSEKIYGINNLPISGNDFGVMTSDKSVELIKKNYNSLKKKYGFTKYLISGLSQIYSTNFYNNNVTTRDLFASNFTSLLHELNTIMPYYAYANLWFSEDLFKIPVHSSNIGIYTDTVPFVQVVLSGYSNLYSDNLNYYSNPKNEVLRLIDFNVNPSVILTKESSYLLKNTGQENIFTSKYSDWRDEVIYIYNYMNEPLKLVRDSKVEKRETLGIGVYKTTYSNGVIIIVNYSDTAFNNGVYSIEKSNYKVY